jgi:CBS domain-containing protein
MEQLEPRAARIRVLVAPEGIRRSVAPGAAADLDGADVLTAPVGCVAGHAIDCVHEHATADDLERFAPRDLDVLPVVDDAFTLRGIVSRDVWRRHGPGAPVTSFMQPVRHAIDERRPLREAFVMMSRRHLRSLPVVTSGGVLSAVLADLDALRWVSDHARRLVRSAHAHVA